MKDELVVIGGENEIVFKLRNGKKELKARVIGPREIIGVPGEWVDAVIRCDSDPEFLKMVLDHILENKLVDRVIVKAKLLDKRTKNLLDEYGFRNLGLNVFVKPIAPELDRGF